ncbi:MAG: rhodanese-like domain-containing protein, partial [Geminicoccaceae bacterium]
MTDRIDAAEAYRRVQGNGEIAFLDLREAGPFSEGHPLFAVPAPYSTLEARIGALIPRPNTPLVLIDGGDGIASAGAEALASMGYTDIAVIDGGVPAWADAGFTLFKGVNVPSKILGELAEARWHPKTIDAPTFDAWQREGRALSLLDCRPPAEYRKMTVPGAACLPNGEIAHRLPVLDRETPIVVTCAGRTRGIIGSLGLTRVAPDREIYALEDGTQGWALAGFKLQRGNP